MVGSSTLRQVGVMALGFAGVINAEANPFFKSELTADSGIEKRQSGTYAITGATNSPTTQTRLEIRQLQANADQWNLFLLAMQDFKGADQAPIDSYYMISEIHGVPNVPWDGVGNDGGGTQGYCTHLSPLFPAWHRAYMALFEQAFINHVNIVVNSFQGADHDRYAAAASTIRFPYWDWAAVPADGQPVLPPSMTDLNVVLNTPTGPQQVLNPLFRYDFHPLDHAGMQWDPWDNWNVTLRYPYDVTPTSGDDNPQAVTVVQNDNPSLRTRVYNLMTQCQLYEGFSNADPSQRPASCPESLEDIHNNIHNDVGGAQQGHQGHMAIIPLASYDPAFYLHHFNVDRLYALWQGIYPEAYTINGHTAAATYAIPENTQCSPDTDLAPFHSDANGNFHTSASVRDTNTFKYNYPEFASGDVSPAGIMAKVNALYGNGAAPAAKRSIGNPYQPVAGAGKRGVVDDATSIVGDVKSAVSKLMPTPSPGSSLLSGLSNVTSLVGNSMYDLPSDLAKQLTPTGRGPVDYNCKITIQPYSLGGSATVFVFMGNPTSENPATWRSDKNCIGWTGTFSSPKMMNNKVTQATIPLTAALLKQQANGIIPGIAVNQTLPLLQKQLNWRVEGPNGVLSPEQVPGLTVGVQSAKVSAAKSNSEFPKFDTYQTHHEATHGKAGGIQQGMSGDWYSQCEPHTP